MKQVFTAFLLALLTASSLSAGESKRLSVQDFEKDFPLAKWPTKAKGELSFSTEWKKDGKRSLKIDPGLMFAFGQLQNTNWSGYTVLRIHLYNPGEKAINVGFEIQDRHKSFHERHQNGFGISPGEQVIDLDIAGGLWRGEENKPYIGKIKTPIDLKKITRIAFINKGSTPLYIDQIEAVLIPKLATPGGFAFDFGKVKTQVMRNFTGVFNNTRYNDKQGFGLTGSTSVLGKSMSFPTPMLGDGIGFRGEGAFKVKLPGGKYRGIIAFERGGFWEDEYSCYDAASLQLDGKTIQSHSFARDGNAFLFQDVEISNFDNVTQKLIWPAHAIHSFEFVAKAGVNSFSLDVKNPQGYPLRIAGLMLAPDTGAGKAFLQAHLAAQKKAVHQTFAGIDKSRRKGRQAPAEDLVVESLTVGEEVFPGDYPSHPKGNVPAPVTAVAGQKVTIHLGVYAASEQSVSVSSELNKGTASVKPAFAYGRYLPVRTYGVGGAWIEISHYRPESTFTAGPRLTRSLIVEYAVPKDATKQTISDVILVKGTNKTLRVPVSIQVLPVKLVPIPIPVGLYMSASLPASETLIGEEAWWKIMESLVREQAEAGLTCQSGGPGIRYRMSGSGENLKFDGANAVRFVRMAQKYGTLHATVGYGGFTGPITRVKADPVQYTRALHAFLKQNNLPPHVHNGYDEPRFAKDYTSIGSRLEPFTKAGAMSAGWTSWHKDNPAWEGLVRKSYAAALNIHQAEHISTIKSWGVHPWVYNNGLDRYGLGIHLWRGIKLGVEGRMQWIGVFTQGFAFHNLDGREPSFGCFLIHKKLGALKTPRWLSVREGLLDCRIRLTLEKHVNKDDPALKIWTLDGYKKDQPAWTDKKLEQSRVAMLKRLVEL